MGEREPGPEILLTEADFKQSKPDFEIDKNGLPVEEKMVIEPGDLPMEFLSRELKPDPRVTTRDVWEAIKDQPGNVVDKAFLRKVIEGSISKTR